MPIFYRSDESLPEKLSFGLEIFADGRIAFDFWDVLDPSSVPEYLANDHRVHNGGWFSGLRPAAGEASGLHTRAVEYSTNQPGIYIPRQWVKSGNRIEFCRFGAHLCGVPPLDPSMNAFPLMLSPISPNVLHNDRIFEPNSNAVIGCRAAR
eukprot:GABV01008875.1.p2 GENE.GABV01008875.1~~GABV01008875.1.p2  ORF type:complete len:151 (+),score=43.13 GABV01008875.1:339-791(+)